MKKLEVFEADTSKQNDTQSSQPSSSTLILSEWLTTKEAANYLRCAVKTLYNYKCQGKIKAYCFGGRTKGSLRFKKNDLDSFITGKK